MRRARCRLRLLLRVRFFLLFLYRGRGNAPVQDVHRGLVGGQHVLGRQRRDHRVAEPGLPELRRYPAGSLIHPAGRDRHAQQHAHHQRGALRRHVPVTGQQHRGRVQHRAVGHRARVRARRRLRERDRPAARAQKARQRPLGHLPDHFHVDDLRPPRARRLRAIQPRLTAAALRRRLRVLRLIRVRVTLQALALVTGLTASLAVLTALTLGLLPRPPRFFRPDPLLRAGRPRVRAVHRQPALYLRQPQLQPALPLQRRLQARPQRRDLLVLRPDHSPQPRHQVTLPAGYPRLIRHEPQACSTCTKSSTTAAHRRVAPRPREWTRMIAECASFQRDAVAATRTSMNSSGLVPSPESVLQRRSPMLVAVSFEHLPQRAVRSSRDGPSMRTIVRQQRFERSPATESPLRSVAIQPEALDRQASVHYGSRDLQDVLH